MRGMLHWRAIGQDEQIAYGLVVSFHMGDEVFNHFGLPVLSHEDYGSFEDQDWHIIPWKESVGLLFILVTRQAYYSIYGW